MDNLYELYLKMLVDEFRDKLRDLGEDEFIDYTQKQSKKTLMLMIQHYKDINTHNDTHDSNKEND